MTTTTKLVWGVDCPNTTDLNILEAKAAEMQTQGKTDNQYTVEPGTPTSTQHTVTRTWTTVADAEEWITFALQYNPDSAEIVP